MSRSQLLFVPLLVSCGLLPLLGQTPPAAEPAKKAAAKLDRYGDPLPEGAVARLGTLRMRHIKPITSVAYSADGEMIASGGYDGFVHVWRASDGKELRTEGYAGQEVRDIAFSKDGKFLAVLWNDALIVRSIPGWAEVFRKERHGGTALALSPVSYTLALAKSDGQNNHAIQLIAFETAVLRRELPSGGDAIGTLAFSPDGKLLASGGGLREVAPKDASVRVWDVTSGKELHRLESHNEAVRSVAFSGDGKLLASGSHDSLCVWEVREGRKLRERKEYVDELAFFPDGKLAFGGYHVIKVHDLAGDKTVQVIETPPQHVHGIALSPDGKVLTAACALTLRSWPIPSGKEVRPVIGHRDPIRALAWTPDGSKIITAAGFNEVIIWEASTGRILHEITLPDPDNVAGLMSPNSLGVFPDNKRFLVLMPGGVSAVWNLETGQFLQDLPDRATLRARQLALSTNGKVLALTHPVLPIIYVWDSIGNKEIDTIDAGSMMRGPPRVICLAWSNDSKTLAHSNSGSDLARIAPEVTFWDLTRKQAGLRLRGIAGGATSLRFSRNNQLLAVARSETKASISVWDAIGGGTIAALDDSARVPDAGAAAFAPGGRALIVAGKDAIARSWDWQGNKLDAELKGHAARIGCLELSPDERYLGTGSDDTTVLIWQQPHRD